MYDMYSWDQAASSADEQAEAAATPDDASQAGKTTGEHAVQPAQAAQAANTAPAAWPARAVQIALDRRDNGGDAGPGRGR